VGSFNWEDLPSLLEHQLEPCSSLVVGCGRDATCKPSVDTVHYGMIKRFRRKGLEALFRTGSTKGVNSQLAPKLRRVLLRLNGGPLPEAMALPGFRLHPLKGDRDGVWSIWITGNCRLTFEIDGEDATNVDLEDYH
jgi:toxin HigB-1